MPTLENSRASESLKAPNLKENSGVRRHLYISPALYVTPEQAPIPESPSPGLISPSPYVANQKRRRVRTETRSGGGVVQTEDLAPENDGDEFDLEEAVDGDGDYFDANDDFSDSSNSNSNVPSHTSRVESELHAIKLSILDEIERRKAAEETLMLMQCQWERICSLMSKAGLSFPAPPASGNMLIEHDWVAQFSQEMLVTRFVAEAMGRGEARAEAEEAAALIIEAKDQELLRLRDRLQYYETVNHELSQRKLVEAAQRQQQRKRQRRWVWDLAGLSIAIGASFVAYACIPHTCSAETSDPTDAPHNCITTPP